MCLLLPKSASATIGHRRINRIGFFSRSSFTARFFIFYVIVRLSILCHCPTSFLFMSLPDLIGQSVYRRLIFRILRSGRSMTTKNIITRLALSCHGPVFYFLCHCSAFYFMSLPDLIGQSVYSRLIFRILRSSRSMTTKNVITRQALSCHCPVFYFLCHCPTSFLFMSLPGLTGQSGCLSHNRPS